MDNGIRTNEEVIEQAISRGTRRYIAARQQKIDAFVQKHFSLRGTLKIHTCALGWDLIRVPLNILWSVVNIVLSLVAIIAKLVRLQTVYDHIQKIPPGLETDIDKQINWLIITELLELPYTDGQRVSAKDALMNEIIAEPALRHLLNEKLAVIDGLKENPAFRTELQKKLAEYGATRTGAADLASNVVLLISSKLTLGQASFGTLSAGTAVSASLAQAIAVSNFWLGPTVGVYYYSIVPVAVSMRLFIAVTAVIAIVLALLSTFIGILTDPLQAKLGIKQKQLRKLMSAIEVDLLNQQVGKFHLREKYAGRLLDLVDFLSILSRP